MDNQTPSVLQPSADPASHERRSAIKELLPIALLSFSVLIMLAVVLFYNGSFFADAAKKPELIAMVNAARTYVNRDHLSWPEGANGLEIYQDALNHYPESSSVQSGIKKIGSRYQDLILELIADRDYFLASETYKRAINAASVMGDKDFNDALQALKVQIDALQARAEDVKRSESLEPLSTFEDALSIGGFAPKMVVMPAGSFTLGSPSDEEGRDGDEGPLVQVTLQPFAIGLTEVSFNEYKAYAEAVGGVLPDDNGWGRGERPVIYVSWREARQYAQWLSQQTGYTYRLPSESEWEYAARAGTQSVFSFGECVTSDQVNFDGRDGNTLPGCASSDFRGKTVEVTALAANPWGLYQVHGNVREWLKDCWEMSYYEHPSDGRNNYVGEGGSCGNDGKRITRGGAWNAGIKSARSANRFAQDENRAFNNVGIRLVREL